MVFFLNYLLDYKMHIDNKEEDDDLIYNKIRSFKDLKRSIIDPYSSMRSGVILTFFFLPTTFFMIKNILWCLIVTILAISHLLQNEDLNRSAKNNFQFVGLDFCITTLLVVSAFTRLISELIECFKSLAHKISCSDEKDICSSIDYDDDYDNNKDDDLIEGLCFSINVDNVCKKIIYDAYDYVMS